MSWESEMETKYLGPVADVPAFVAAIVRWAKGQPQFGFPALYSCGQPVRLHR